MPTNTEFIYNHTGYLYSRDGLSIDMDWLRKARRVSNAAERRDITEMRLLHDSGLIRGYTEYLTDFSTPLMTCIHQYHMHEQDPDRRPEVIEMVRLLLENGADPYTIFHNDNWGVLHEATVYADTELVRLIISNGLQNLDSTNPLFRHRNFVNNDFVNQRDMKGRTPLHLAADALPRDVGNTDIIQILIEYGADVHAVDNTGSTPLFEAIQEPDKIQFLIQHGARVNAIDNWGETPLSRAVSRPDYVHTLCQCLPGIKTLCQNGADIHIANNIGETPLHVSTNHTPALKFLIERGADVHAVNEDGETPLANAVQSENIESVIALFQAGCDLSHRDNNDVTPLHEAVRSRPITLFLLDNGVDINAVENRGRTALHIAVTCEMLPSAKLLWQRGTNLAIRDVEHSSAEDICFAGNPCIEIFEAEILERRNEAFAMGHHRNFGTGEGSIVQMLSADLVGVILNGV